MATLRDPLFRRSSVTQEDLDNLTASGMTEMGRAWESGRIGADVNAAMADVAALRTSQRPEDQARADELEAEVGRLRLRQAPYAPTVGRVEDVNSLESAADWAAYQIGAGAASMTDPLAASAALQGAGRLVGQGPGVLRGAGAALKGAGYAVPYLMNRRQLIGENYGQMVEDDALMQGTTAQQRYDAANLAGSGGAVLDTMFPGMVAGKLTGAGLRQGVARSGLLPRTAAGMGMEGATELGQGEIGRAALDFLNPERDTSGDMSARLNEFAGGAVGAGPFALAGEMADSSYRRTGVAADTVQRKAGETIDLLSEKAQPIIDKAKDKVGGVIDLKAFQNDDGGVDLGKVLDATKAGAIDLGEQAREAATGIKRDPRLVELLDFNPADDSAVPQDVALGGPERIGQWRRERLAMKDDFIQDEIQKVADRGDAVARQLVDKLGAAQDEDSFNLALEESGQYIKSQWDAEDRAAIGSRAAGLARLAGKAGASAGKAALNLGRAVWDGAKGEWTSKKNAQGQTADFSAILKAELPEAGFGQADRAAMQMFADRLADRLSRLGEVWKTAPTNNKTKLGDLRPYNVMAIAEDMGALYGDRAPEVLTQIAEIHPELADVAPVLAEQVQNIRTPAGRKALSSAKLTMANRMVSLLPATAAQLPGDRRLDLLNAVERVAEGSAEPGLRKALAAAVGEDALRQMLQMLNDSPLLQPKAKEAPGETIDDRDATPEKKVSESDDAGEGEGEGEGKSDAYEQRAAEKRVDSGRAPSLYGFSKSPTLRNSIRDADPFAPIDRKQKSDGKTTPNRPKLFRKGEKLSDGRDAISARVQGMEDYLGVVRDEIAPNDPYLVSAHSALDVMRRLGMQPAKMIALLRDYLRMDLEGEDLKANPELASRYQALAQQAADAVLDLMDGGKQTPDGKRMPRLTAAQMDEVNRQLMRYFSSRFVAVAEQIADRVPEKLTAGEIDDFIKTAQLRLRNIEGAARKRAEAGEDFNAVSNEMRAEQNLLLFKDKNGKDVPIRAHDLVRWVREQGKLYQERDGEATGWKKDDLYLADVLSGINAVLASGKVADTLPTMRDRFGRSESFADGIPDSLRLVTQTQYKRRMLAEKRAGNPERKDRTVDTRSLEYQEKVAAEYGPDPSSGSNIDAAPESEAVTPEYVAEGMTDEELAQYAALPNAKARAEFRKSLNLRRSGEGYVPGQSSKTDSRDAAPLDFYPERKRGEVPDERDDAEYFSRQGGKSVYDPVPYEAPISALGSMLQTRTDKLRRALSGDFVVARHLAETGAKDGQERLSAAERKQLRDAQDAGVAEIASRLRAALRPTYDKNGGTVGGFHYIYPALQALQPEKIQSYVAAGGRYAKETLAEELRDLRMDAIAVIADADVKPEVKLRAARMIASEAVRPKLTAATLDRFLQANASAEYAIDQPSGQQGFRDTTRDVSKKPLVPQTREVGARGGARSLSAETYARTGQAPGQDRGVKTRQQPAAQTAAPKEGLDATISRYTDYIKNPPADWSADRVRQIATWAKNRRTLLSDQVAELEQAQRWEEAADLADKGVLLTVLQRDAEQALQQDADAKAADPTLFAGSEVPAQGPKSQSRLGGVRKLNGRSPYLAKDQRKADQATKFIGRGSSASSTAQYARDLKDIANTGQYTASDVVFVSAEGARAGRMDPDFAEIRKAVEAGATFITDDATNRNRPYNVGERQVAEALTDAGYRESAPGRWTPAGAADWSGQGRKLNAQAVEIHDSLGRFGFAATHDSPVRHAGKFDWRAHQGKGEGNAAFGAGTYLSTSDGVHKSYKAQFTSAARTDRSFKWGGVEYSLVYGEDDGEYSVERNDDKKASPAEEAVAYGILKHGYSAKEALKRATDAVFSVVDRSADDIIDLIDVSLPTTDFEDAARALYAKLRARKPVTAEEASGFHHWFSYERWNRMVAAAEKKSEAFRTIDISDIVIHELKNKSPTYQVSVDIEQHELLDWDKPLSKQSAHVRAALEGELRWKNERRWSGETSTNLVVGNTAFGKPIWAPKDNPTGKYLVASDPLSRYGDKFDTLDEAKAFVTEEAAKSSLTGQYVYQGLVQRLGSQTAASDHLQSLGIPGHRYNAEGGKNDEHPNYVIYDDRRITTNYVHFNAQANGKFSGWKAGTPSTDKEVAEAKAYIDRVLGPKIKVDFEQTMGHSGEWIEASETIKIALNAAAGIMPTAYHEAMHAFFSRYVKSNPKVLNTMKALAENEQVLARVHALLDGYPAAQAQLRDGEERLAYIYQFWAAGQLSIPVPAGRTWLQKLRKFFRQVLGRVTAEERAGAILEALHEGKLREPDAAQRVLADLVADKAWTTKARRNFDGLIQGAAALAMPAHEILTTSASPTAKRLAARFYASPADESAGSKPGFLNAVKAERTRRINAVAAALEGLEDRDHVEVVAYLQQAKDPATIPYEPHRRAVETIRRELDDFWVYAREAGLDLGKVENYFPVVWDTEKLVEQGQAFVQMLLEHYRPQMEEARESAAMAGVAITAEEAAWRLHTVLVDRQVFDGKLAVQREDGVLVPFFEASNNRKLDWIAPEHREPFLDKGLVSTLSKYFHQGVRASEYTRRFGADGKLLDTDLKAIERELLAAAPQQPGLEDDKAKQSKWVARQMRDVRAAVSAMEGTLGKDITETHRKINSWLVVYQNVRLLPLALFSSFVDPLSIVARGGDFKTAGEAFANGMRGVFSNWRDMIAGMPKERQKDEWERLAEFVGATEAAVLSHHVAEEYSSQYMSPRAKRINDMMFKLNGMEAWNRAMRVGATKGAVQFIIKHKDMPEQHSARWLRELGLGREDIIVQDGKLLIDRADLVAAGLSRDKAEEVSGRLRTAVNRWVEGAVLTPNSAQRPAWSSDPRWSFLFHLKQFTYSFHQTILRRAWNETKHGNMAPMGALALFVPTMIAADITKGLIQGGGDLPMHMQGKDAGDWMLHGVQRAGLLGYGQIGVDTGADWSSLAGPSVEQVVDAFRQPVEDTVVKALPANALYREALR